MANTTRVVRNLVVNLLGKATSYLKALDQAEKATADSIARIARLSKEKDRLEIERQDKLASMTRKHVNRLNAIRDTRKEDEDTRDRRARKNAETNTRRLQELDNKRLDNEFNMIDRLAKAKKMARRRIVDINRKSQKAEDVAFEAQRAEATLNASNLAKISRVDLRRRKNIAKKIQQAESDHTKRVRHINARATSVRAGFTRQAEKVKDRAKRRQEDLKFQSDQQKEAFKRASKLHAGNAAKIAELEFKRDQQKERNKRKLQQIKDDRSTALADIRKSKDRSRRASERAKETSERTRDRNVATLQARRQEQLARRGEAVRAEIERNKRVARQIEEKRQEAAANTVRARKRARRDYRDRVREIQNSAGLTRMQIEQQVKAERRRYRDVNKEIGRADKKSQKNFLNRINNEVENHRERTAQLNKQHNNRLNNIDKQITDEEKRLQKQKAGFFGRRGFGGGVGGGAGGGGLAGALGLGPGGTAFVSAVGGGLSIARNIISGIGSGLLSVVGSAVEYFTTGISTAFETSGKIAAPVLGIAKVSLDEFTKFNQAMTESTAIMDHLTEDQRLKLESLALTLSGKVAQSATELAHGFYALSSAGLNVQQTMAALPAMANFATAGMINLKEATTLVVGAQTALGLTSKDPVQNLANLTEVTDVLTKANNLALGTILDFSQALTRQSAATARMYGLDLYQAVAILGAYARQNVRGAIAGTQMSMMLRHLNKQAIKHSVEFKKLGISVYDAQGNFRNMADILDDMRLVFGKMSPQLRSATLLSIGFDARIQQSILPLLESSEAIRDFEKALKDAGGTTEQVATRQLQSFYNQLKIVWNQLTVIAIGIGREIHPVVLLFTDIVRELVKIWQSLSPKIKSAVISFIMVSAVVFSAAAALMVVWQTLSILTGGFNLVAIAILGVIAAFGSMAGLMVVNAGGINKLFGEMTTNAGKWSKRLTELASVGPKALKDLSFREKLEDFLNYMEPVRRAFRELMSSVVRIASSAGAELNKIFTNLFGGFNIDNFRDGLVNALRFAEYSLINIKQTVQYLLLYIEIKYVEFLTKTLPALIKFTSDSFAKISNWTIDVFAVGLTAISLLAIEAFNVIKKNSGNFGDWFQGWWRWLSLVSIPVLVVVLGEALIKFFGVMGTALTDTLSGNWKKAKEDLNKYLGHVKKEQESIEPPKSPFTEGIDPARIREIVNNFRKAITAPNFKWELLDTSQMADIPELQVLKRKIKVLGDVMSKGFLDFKTNRIMDNIVEDIFSGFEDLGAKAVPFAQQTGKEIGKGLGQGMQGELKKFDAALFKSAEGLARIREYNQMLEFGITKTVLPKNKKPALLPNVINIGDRPGQGIPANKVPIEKLRAEGGDKAKDALALEYLRRIMEAEEARLRNPKARIGDAELA